MPKFDDSYEVGYGKPPKSGQFTKGNSGNRAGRPKGSKNLHTIVLRESRQPVRINGPRGTRTVTKLHATVMQLTNKAAQGELRATRELIPLVARAEEAANSTSMSPEIHELDRKVLDSLRRRMESMTTQTDQNSGGQKG